MTLDATASVSARALVACVLMSCGDRGAMPAGGPVDGAPSDRDRAYSRVLEVLRDGSVQMEEGDGRWSLMSRCAAPTPPATGARRGCVAQLLDLSPGVLPERRGLRANLLRYTFTQDPDPEFCSSEGDLGTYDPETAVDVKAWPCVRVQRLARAPETELTWRESCRISRESGECTVTFAGLGPVPVESTAALTWPLGRAPRGLENLGRLLATACAFRGSAARTDPQFAHRYDDVVWALLSELVGQAPRVDHGEQHDQKSTTASVDARLDSVAGLIRELNWWRCDQAAR